MTGEVDPSRILVTCVSEPTEAWVTKTENLVLSVRRFGGRMADVKIVTSFVDEPPVRPERLAALGATVKVVPRHELFGVFKTSNKLRMFEAVADEDFDALLALDCDVIVTGDVSSAASATHVRAVPASTAHFKDDQWELIYDELELPAPTTRVRAPGTGEMGYPYYNSGVVFMPVAHVPTLATEWEKHIRLLIDLNERTGGRIDNRIRSDQPGLQCALVANDIPFRALTLNHNYPTPRGWLAPEYDDEGCAPWVLHYHHRIDDDGFILPSIHPRLNKVIDHHNRVRAEEFGLPYAGLASQPLSKRVDGWLAQIPPYRTLRRRHLAGRPGGWPTA